LERDGEHLKTQCILQALTEVPSKVSGHFLALDPIFISSENGWHSSSDESETETSLSQWAHETTHAHEKPSENVGCDQQAGSSQRSTACTEIMVLKEATRKTRRRNYLQKQNSYRIKIKERLSGSAATFSSAKESLKWQRRSQEPIQHIDQAAPIRSVSL